MSRFALIAVVLISTLFSFQVYANNNDVDVMDRGNVCYDPSQVKLLSKSIIRRSSGHKISYACLNQECERMNFVIYNPDKNDYCEINSANAVSDEDILEVATDELVDSVKREKIIYYPYSLSTKLIAIGLINGDTPAVRVFAFLGLLVVAPVETLILPAAIVAAPYTLFDKIIAPLKVKKALATKEKDQKVNMRNFKIIYESLRFNR